ncbi:hypothetical protein [Marinoscillum sp.]|uniref:hypothetical protein n=1 Tax=Marinoscillum sp. TaxID=2024838 RepID=UPI003BA8D054
MRKVLTHGIYILVILGLAVYAQIKRTEAIKQTQLAETNAMKAEENAQMAQMAAAEARAAQDRAKQQLMIAEEQAAMAQKALAKCQGK